MRPKKSGFKYSKLVPDYLSSIIAYPEQIARLRRRKDGDLAWCSVFYSVFLP